MFYIVHYSVKLQGIDYHSYHNPRHPDYKDSPGERTKGLTKQNNYGNADKGEAQYRGTKEEYHPHRSATSAILFIVTLAPLLTTGTVLLVMTHTLGSLIHCCAYLTT